MDRPGHEQAQFFIGKEVEHSPAWMSDTLFVVGVQPVEDIIQRAWTRTIRHLYFGTSQSFTPKTDEDYRAWENMIKPLLKEGYWCTLDYDVRYIDGVLECGFDEYNNYISMISVKMPYIKLLNYNATLKIDDTTWGHSNSGVWCHSVHDLMDRQVYTDWKDYTGDKEVK